MFPLVAYSIVANMLDHPPDVPIHDIGKLIRTPAPKSHRAKLAPPVAELLEETEEALRREIKKCLKVLMQLLPTADDYQNVSVRLAGFLKDYMRISGADEAEQEAKDVRKAVIGVEAFVERQLRQQAINADKEAQRDRQTRQLKSVQVSDDEADRLSDLSGLADCKPKTVDVSEQPGVEGTHERPGSDDPDSDDFWFDV